MDHMDSVWAAQLHGVFVLESQRSSSSDAHPLVFIIVEVALDQLGKVDGFVEQKKKQNRKY